MRRLLWGFRWAMLKVLSRFTSQSTVGILEKGDSRTLVVATGWRLSEEFVLLWYPTPDFRERHLDVQEGALTNAGP